LLAARVRRRNFTLASNQIDLDPEVMLNYYKGQQTVERGFRFLKDKSFHVSEVYLKKDERIEALCMIMVLSLLIYSFAEWKLKGTKRDRTDSPKSAKQTYVATYYALGLRDIYGRYCISDCGWWYNHKKT
jgi:transposase